METPALPLLPSARASHPTHEQVTADRRVGRPAATPVIWPAGTAGGQSCTDAAAAAAVRGPLCRPGATATGRDLNGFLICRDRASGWDVGYTVYLLFHLFIYLLIFYFVFVYMFGKQVVICPRFI